MNGILTHEQADFDAVAALLGAWLLNESAVAILPSRLNRNVRRFINLYGTELPFTEIRDIPSGSIEKIILVDTQSMITLKGVSSKTMDQIVDHHPLRPDLPKNWTSNIDKLGAATTIFVERLQDHLNSLSVVQATLLLLGIYEDTGSLTYASTTPRDIRAAAALLEIGGSLRMAADFLNPALSDEQKLLSDRLLANIQTLKIHGKVILIAQADATGMNEEVSTIAHKIRDLLDPDGLFLIIRSGDGIRIVARSTSDQVDVARVAALFGGGGHERAASALIDPRSPDFPTSLTPLDEIANQLIKALPDIIQPSITVGKIMSKHPLLLTPETTLDEAARVMQRYGYEGFPVISDGQVAGLLTRRSVDRALAHHLKLTAGSLMEAGDYSLTTKDTIDQLQALMASTGWGQIPVIDRESHKVVGIVTRTDLLKTLPQGNTFVPGKINYAGLIKKTLSEPRLALLEKVAEEAAIEHLPIYIVGGFVRDLILNWPSADFDIVVEGEAIHLANKLCSHYGGRVIAHNRFGTAKWFIKEIKKNLANEFSLTHQQTEGLPDSLDLVSARTEFYDRPTALPTIEHSSIKLDLHRRDFTINTMALRMDGRHFGELYDYWDGLADLQKKQVKVLHSLSFVDDPTRLLRAVRFEQRFHFKIEARTLQLMDEARSLLKQVSGERLRHEFNLVFNEENPLPILIRLQELNLLTSIHPSLCLGEFAQEPLKAALKTSFPVGWNLPEFLGHMPIRLALAYLVWLIPLGETPSLEITNRLRLNNLICGAMHSVSRIWAEREHLELLKPSEFFNKLNGLPDFAGYALKLLAGSGEFKDKIEAYYSRWQFLMPVTDGERLKQLGLLPGPRYSEIIQRLRSAWIDDEVSTPEQESTLLGELLKS